MSSEDADDDDDLEIDDDNDVDEAATDAPPRSPRDWLNWLRQTIFG